MEINTKTIIKILTVLSKYYPMALDQEAYEKLEKDVGGELILKGYILYLTEKNLIISDIKYSAFNGGMWSVQPRQTRINAFGIDYLQEDDI